jgi:hypothetical protein
VNILFMLMAVKMTRLAGFSDLNMCRYICFCLFGISSMSEPNFIAQVLGVNLFVCVCVYAVV